MGAIQGGTKIDPLINQPNAIIVNETGLNSLVLESKVGQAKSFKKWICSEVLPSIRKYGYYKSLDNPKTLTFKIENEYDLHVKVVDYIRKLYAGLGELQDTSNNRIESYKKGYQKGTPDLIIQNMHNSYYGFCSRCKFTQRSTFYFTFGKLILSVANSVPERFLE